MVVRLADDVRMTVLFPNADEAERQSAAGGGARCGSPGRPSTCTSSASRKPSRQTEREPSRRQHDSAQVSRRGWSNRLSVGCARRARGAGIGLAACGGDDRSAAAATTTCEVAEPATSRARSRSRTGSATSTRARTDTIAKFEAKYPGTTVNYIEDVNDNADFFGKVQPQLDKGESGGRSIFVVTDWMAKQMYDLGYLQEIDHADLPNVRGQPADDLEQPAVRPGAQVLGAVAERHDRAARSTRSWRRTFESVNDLFDPKYKGKVTVLTEMRDTVPLMLKANGIDPAEATKEEWLEQIDKLQEAVDSGQLRRFTGNDYIQDLTNENVVAAIGWSGDISLIEQPGRRVARCPTDGCILWSDNMVIPVGAPNTAAALAWMDFVYDPEVQADIADYVRYVTPVAGQGDRPSAIRSSATNPLIFPTTSSPRTARTQPTRPVTPRTSQEVTEAFQDVITD